MSEAEKEEERQRDKEEEGKIFYQFVYLTNEDKLI